MQRRCFSRPIFSLKYTSQAIHNRSWPLLCLFHVPYIVIIQRDRDEGREVYHSEVDCRAGAGPGGFRLALGREDDKWSITAIPSNLRLELDDDLRKIHFTTSAYMVFIMSACFSFSSIEPSSMKSLLNLVTLCSGDWFHSSYPNLNKMCSGMTLAAVMGN